MIIFDCTVDIESLHILLRGIFAKKKIYELVESEIFVYFIHRIIYQHLQGLRT